MKSAIRILAAVGACCASASVLRAQSPDTAVADSGISIRSLWSGSSDRTGLRITSGKQYNRVTGMPILFGPIYRDSGDNVTTRVAAMGILRSSNNFRWDSENIGHAASAGFRFGRDRKLGFDLQSYDFVDGTQSWQMGEPEAGLAAFFLHRDYNDYYGRHGASMAGSFGLGARSRVQVELRDERWASRKVRDVFTIVRNGESWRDNPQVDDGRVHLGLLTAMVDTRNDASAPLYGWLVNAEYENARGTFGSFGPTSSGVRSIFSNDVQYGRVFVDVRRYNRISPSDQVNMRLVLGGWLHGDE
ncbi:MAG: hypothetical protein H0W69_11315, partial [Gemmatimonadaceae bacterium]|nr:hypothetical protein [Gemmatimonadaceae bacterium]